jgi:antirestriction protein
MSITLTANYKETLATVTVEKIEELVDDNYALDDILEFIDNHNESDFVAHYEEYVRVGDIIGYEAVDALIEEMSDISYIEDCDERYRGFYDNEADFAEEFYNEVYGDVPSFLVVDWEATWDQSLRYDFTACRDGSNYKPCHIFSDN